MILIGVGANLVHPRHGSPRRTCEAAVNALPKRGIEVLRRSRWYESAPVPPSDQPWFINGVIEVATALSASALLDALHAVEAEFGRVRGAPDAARVLDLDLLAYGDQTTGPGARPALPHPRMAERAFVILPLAELEPDWRHPVTGRSAARLSRELPLGQVARPVAKAGSHEAGTETR